MDVMDWFSKSERNSLDEGAKVQSPPPEETVVFIVDGDGGTANALVSLLEGRGFSARAFDDSHEAAKAIRSEKLQALISETDVSGSDGLDLARIALEEDPDTAVVMLSGTRDPEPLVRAFRLGAADCFLKPLDLAAVEEAV